MADYYAKTRTNYFDITDEDKFRKIIGLCSASNTIEVDKNVEGKFVFTCNGTINGLFNGEDDDFNHGDFCKALQEVLPDGEAIIITEVGSEKMRYLAAASVVITNSKIETVNIKDVALNCAKRLLGNDEYDTEMEY
jgi:hypothetical protein